MRVYHTAVAAAKPVLNDGERMKLNDGADSFFYNYPRMCYHVDAGFLNHLTELYRWGWSLRQVALHHIVAWHDEQNSRRLRWNPGVPLD